MISFELPIQTHANPPRNSWKSKHWGNKKAGMVGAKRQREVARLMMRLQRGAPRLPVLVTLTRHDPPRGRKMDHHNIPQALKHVVDGISDAYQVDDGNRAMIRFEFRQGRWAQPGVRVEVTEWTRSER